jgi:predicted HTH transcriptional regulator
MDEETYRSIVFANHEDRNREFKASFPWDRASQGDTMAKVVRTILAMGNLRDGGHIVIGVKQVSDGSDLNEFTPDGVQEDHLRTYSQDVVSDWVKDYADPAAPFSLDIKLVEANKFVIISVEGFQDYPVICKRSYGDNILSEGSIYYRPKSGRPRSERISSYTDMRELMDIATERGVRRYFEMQKRIGQVGANDPEMFDDQIADFS